jgi:hypothetical protein
MSSSVLTRKATTRQLEMQLRETLEAYHRTKKECEQLIREREENEVEVAKVVDRNTVLKNKLSSLHNDYLESVDKCEDLQNIVDTFNDCASTYETTLKRVSELESELSVANQTIVELRSECDSHRATHTQSLYRELMGSQGNPVLSTLESSIIDLTKDDTSSLYFTSRKNLKKYIKLKKIIRGLKKIVKSKFCAQKNVKLMKERRVLLNRLSQSSEELKNNIHLHDNHTRTLQADITRLENSLRDIHLKYELSKREIKEHTEVATRLAEMSRENEERFYSLINNHLCSECSCAPSQAAASEPSTPSLCCVQPTARASSPTAAPTPHAPAPARRPTSPEPRCRTPPRAEPTVRHPDHPSLQEVPALSTVVYSDELGTGLGLMLSKCLRQKVTNNCLRGASVECFVDRLMKDRFDRGTTLVLVLGNSVTVRRLQLEALLQALTDIERRGIQKIILCALPYSKWLSHDQNLKISKLNSIMYNVTCYQNNFHFFDLNKLCKTVKMYNNRMYMSEKCKIATAKLLAYNISPEHGGSAAGGGAAPRTPGRSPASLPIHLN